jgi:endonuclease I
VLYFALRYPGTLDEMPPESYALLLAWHQDDPVTLWEQHRNAAIHHRQGNRNPFIDHPARAPDLLPGLLGGSSLPQRRTAPTGPAGDDR